MFEFIKKSEVQNLNKIVLITPGQPSTNPRLVKEAKSLAENGYEVTVLYCYWAYWADKTDEKLLQQNLNIHWIRVGGHPVFQKSIYWFTRLKHKFYHISAGIFMDSVYLQQRACIRCYRELKNEAAAHQAQLYIAHNLGALAPAAQAAKKNKTFYSFDAEDYHRGQSSIDSVESKMAILIEDRYLPGISFCTAASPLIAVRYKELYPDINPIVVNNVFSTNNIKPSPIPYRHGDTLKLFWFSQTLGNDRGLETVIAAMGRLKKINSTFTILGYCNQSERQRLLSLAVVCNLKEEQINFKEPVSPDKIFDIAYSHHIGLALESNKTINRRIALTNKIFTYPMAGLAIIATDTPGQRDFMERYPAVGSIYTDKDDLALAYLLESLANDPAKLNTQRLQAWNLANTSLNWEKEQSIFLNEINKIMH